MGIKNNIFKNVVKTSIMNISFISNLPILMTLTRIVFNSIINLKSYKNILRKNYCRGTNYTFDLKIKLKIKNKRENLENESRFSLISSRRSEKMDLSSVKRLHC